MEDEVYTIVRKVNNVYPDSSGNVNVRIGSKWFIDLNIPTEGMEVGDFWLNATNGVVYEYQEGEWVRTEGELIGPTGPPGQNGTGSFVFINKPGVTVKTWISDEIFSDADGKFVVDYSDAQFEGILDFSINTFKAKEKKGAYFIYSQLHGDYTNEMAEGEIFVVKNDGFLMFGKNRLEDKLAKVIVKVTGY